jgi:NAD(P)-dependent dehydrogenase (short-subunit alcohol dehydrogenase family)
MAQPEEIAYVVGFLADERAGYITGVNISPNGGLFISF